MVKNTINESENLNIIQTKIVKRNHVRTKNNHSIKVLPKKVKEKATGIKRGDVSKWQKKEKTVI
jgi:hypothetical protein